MTSEEEILDLQVRREGNRAVAIASKWAALLGVVGSLSIASMILSGQSKALLLPMSIAMCGAISSAGLSWLAKRELLYGARAFAVLGAYASLPTILFIISHWTVDGGVGVFMIGPMSYLYALLILVSACLFRFRYPFVISIIVALGYLLCAWFAMPFFEQVRSPSPQFDNELASLAVWANKSIIFLFIGLTGGGLAQVGKRLAKKMAAETRRQEQVRRLFGEYVSSPVVDRILAGGGAPVRAHVAVLFSDIRGFTSYSEKAEPAELVERLNEYFEQMVAAVHGNGGVVDKFIGDAVMAVFGGVAELENPAASAVAAAKEMAERLDGLNQRWRAAGKEAWQAGIGVHLGDVILGGVGSDDRKDFTVIGDAVNTASRLESMTKELGHELLISGAAHAALDERWQAVGSYEIRGRSAKLEVFARPL